VFAAIGKSNQLFGLAFKIAKELSDLRMIIGTNYSPQKAFVAFAREFLDYLAKNDYSAALAKLDQTSKKWSKAELRSVIQSVLGDELLVSAAELKRSAVPELIEVEPGQFILHHRISVASGWSKARLTFRFVQKPKTQYFHVILEGVID
jgi:hypothetical protein